MPVASAVAAKQRATTTFALDNADAYIPRDRRRALAGAGTLPDRVHGAGLFADISGFTPLTEALARELGPQRGAEVLTAHLNRVFQALIDDLDGFGGQVIYFSGDAITCWLDQDDGLRAAACGLAMQATMARIGDVTTPGGLSVHLAVKVAVAVGSARRFVVGDPDVQLIDVLAGGLIDALAAAEHHAEKGELVLAQSALEALEGKARIGTLRNDPTTGERYAIVEALDAPVAASAGSATEPPLPRDVVRRWLLADVYGRLEAGRGEFLAELRPAYPVFLRFAGIDYDTDPQAIAKLDTFVRRVQRIVTDWGGNLLQLTLGDKGAYLYAVFGSPLAHEDDASRAAAAALELRALAGVAPVTDIHIGIAYGRLRSGMYGHRDRQTFTCLGDAVNVAARLMQAALPGEIYVTEAAKRASREGFGWQALPAIALKGKAEDVVAFALTGSGPRPPRARKAFDDEMIGRAAELAAMQARLDEARSGRGGVLAVCGDAGIGKSRLVAEFMRYASDQGVRLARGECQSYGRNAGYFVWRDVWTTLFGLSPAADDDAKAAHVERELAAIDPALVTRAPLLAALLDVSIAENELTSSFDAKLRKSSLESLLATCLRARAAGGPLALVLEDCHWIDPLSADLLEVLGRAASGLPALVVVVHRPVEASSVRIGIEALPGVKRIELVELGEAESARLVAARLRHTIEPDAEPSSALLNLVTSRAQGNPFYIEELFNYIKSQGVDPRDERALARLELPGSLHSLILSRVDKLPEAPRQVLKVASVVGRAFRAPMLPGIYPELGDVDAIKAQLDVLAGNDLVRLEPAEEETYLFKHVVTREVAYESMPFGFRSVLHERIGDYIEETEGEGVERELDLLAHHYWHSENRDKKREYLGRAGAAAQAAYANAVAIDYYERLVPLLSKGSRLDVLLKLGKVLELVGNWHRAEEVDREALAIAEDLDDGLRRAACQTALAEVVRKEGHYKDALELLNRAARGFASFGEENGVARVMHLVGTVWAQRGNYDKALESYNKSLKVRERIGDKPGMASLLSNLGIVAEHRGEYDASREYHERALALRESVGDRWAIGNSMTNLGMVAVLQKRYEEARDWFEKSMAISREIGDAWMVAVCHNNLGNATRGLGDYAAARRHYAYSLRAYRDYDDRWSLAFLLEDVGVLAAESGDPCHALELVGAADAIREAIGAPRAPSLEREIAEHLGRAAAELSQEERSERRVAGRSLDISHAIDCAFRTCCET